MKVELKRYSDNARYFRPLRTVDVKAVEESDNFFYLIKENGNSSEYSKEMYSFTLIK